jgi:CBS domain-containing protein
MQDLVKDWMIDLIVYVDPESSVLEALAKMRRRYLNSLIVSKTEDHPEYGIITSTDICDKIVAPDRDPADIKIKDIMTTPLISVHPDQTVFECAKKMSEHNIHHLPVVDEDNNVVGMISATDFLVVAEAISHGEGDQHLR